MTYKAGHEFKGLENGNHLIKIILSKESIPYSLKIDNEWCRIIHSGQKPYCSQCEEFDHGRRHCEKTQCRRCLTYGHIAIDCDDTTKEEDLGDPRPQPKPQQQKPEEADPHDEDNNNLGKHDEATHVKEDTMETESSQKDKSTLERPLSSSDNTDSEKGKPGWKMVTRRKRLDTKPNLNAKTLQRPIQRRIHK